MIDPTTYWQVTGAQQPWGPFDPDAGLNFSFDVTDFVAKAGVGLTLASAQFIVDATKLTITGTSSTPPGIITCRIDLAVPGSNTLDNTLVPFTLRMTLSDSQHDDRTFYLLVEDR